MTADALVIGAGPAGLAIAGALCGAGVRVAGLAATEPQAPWQNTYGIWRDDLAALGLAGLLGHCWTDTSVYTGEREIALGRAYGLFDNTRLQAHLWQQCARAQMRWHTGLAAQIDHQPHGSRVTTRDGTVLSARVVIDASGHSPAFVQRPAGPPVAYQAAYGIVGRFSRPPVRRGQLVLMDYRAAHLAAAEQAAPPTFLYAMDLGDERYFVEETSLAHAPAIPLDVLERRLHRRLAWMGTQVTEVAHIERCLFPMNLPLPRRDQPVLGYGSAASMVHPATGYQVGTALARAPGVAQAIARALENGQAGPEQVAAAGWLALWPEDQMRKRYLYLFGLHNLMRFNVAQTQAFFSTFFQLPRWQWAGYLSNTLSTAELLRTMLSVFGRAPLHIRAALARSVGGQGGLLWRAFWT